MSKRYSHFFAIGISQFMVGLVTLLQTLFYVQSGGVSFGITVVIDAGLMISGIIFFILDIRKRREYAMSKENKKIWE